MDFGERDFDCFEEKHWRNRESNDARLQVRRKLQKLGKMVLPALAKAGLSLVVKTSLHHPYTHNNYNVRSQWLYFAPQKSELKALKDIMGTSFKELDSHYTHTLLLVGIDYESLFVSLKIHSQAWWDGQNLKNKCSSAQVRSEFREQLNQLEGFSLGIHDWKKRYRCSDIGSSDVSTLLQNYTPGNHWLHIDSTMPRNSRPSDFGAFAERKLLSLVSLYNFIVWRPDNNHIFTRTKG